MEYNNEELLICVLARMLEGLRNVAVGTASPIPGCAALLVQALGGGHTRAMILGSNLHNPFNAGGAELFDRAGQGRMDAFFLGGGQIDGEGNINLVGIGDYPRSAVRLPGSFGSAFLYYVVPRVILFRQEHSRRTLVPKVDFISAAGWSPPGVHRPGGPHALVTGRAIFFYDKERHRFRLHSVMPGHSVKDVRDNTGFDFDCAQSIATPPPPEPERLALIRGPIAAQIAEIYPRFAADRLGYRAG
jgi:glutaconate CoA-transferase, subunit B